MISFAGNNGPVRSGLQDKLAGVGRGVLLAFVICIRRAQEHFCRQQSARGYPAQAPKPKQSCWTDVLCRLVGAKYRGPAGEKGDRAVERQVESNFGEETFHDWSGCKH